MAKDQNKKPWKAELPEVSDSEEARLRRKWEREQKMKETQRERRLREQKKKLRALMILAVTAAVLIVVLAVLTVNVIVPSIRYSQAERLLEDGKYAEAIIAFRKITGYKDADERLQEAIYLQAVKLSGKEDVSYETSATAPWFSITESGVLDFDEDRYKGDWHIKIPDVFDGVLVTELSEQIFAHRTELLSVEISDCVLRIDDYAFLGCNALKEVKLPTHLTVLGAGAFEVCAALESVTFGEKLETIGTSAFAKCKRLTEITLPNSLKTLGGRAFNSCKGLRTVTLGSGLESLGAYPFSSCDALETLYFLGTEAEWAALAADADRLGIEGVSIVFRGSEG